MKILLVHHQDPDDINAFSGTSYFMSREIKAQFKGVQEYMVCDNSAKPYKIDQKANLQGLDSVLRPLGENLTKYLKENKVSADYLLFLGGSSALPYYNSDIPSVLWHDSTWHTYLHGYLTAKSFNEFKRNFKNFYLWDKAALKKADILVYSSDYIAEACMNNYKIPSSKIKVIPFGANIYASPSADFVKAATGVRLSAPIINLTFIGKDSARKGIGEAIELVTRLNAGGIPARLNIIGTKLDIDTVRFPYLINWGFIDKKNKEQFKLFERILKETHFLVHPTQSEPFGIVLCEANAYGIPVLGTDIEGLKTTVKSGINGYLFSNERFIERSIYTIKKIKENFELNYLSLSQSARNEYESRLNWKVNVSLLKNVLSF